MDEQSDSIANADNENRRDRPKDAISLILAVLAAQHAEIHKLRSDLQLVVGRVARLEREAGTW